jgi:hypothetical protein
MPIHVLTPQGCRPVDPAALIGVDSHLMSGSALNISSEDTDIEVLGVSASEL